MPGGESMKTKKKSRLTKPKKSAQKFAKKVLKKVSGMSQRRSGQQKQATRNKKSSHRRSGTVKKNLEFEKVQDLRDIVERLPEMPLPGAPIELPKDLPEENPAMEPAIIPTGDMFAHVSVCAKEAHTKVKVSKPRQSKHGVWLAVVSTFSVILVVWMMTLSGTALVQGKKMSDASDNFEALRAEWRGAAETFKETLNMLGSKLELARAKDEVLPPGEVLQAVGARVIFEAARATSTN